MYDRAEYGYDNAANTLETTREYRARWYDPSVGRFLSEDPSKFRAGINFYGYVRQNPVRFIDPTGRDAEEIKDAIVAVGYAKALKAYLLSEDALDLAQKWAREHSARFRMWNGSGDAFRHCLWSCLMAQQIGIDNAAIIAASHERAGDRQGQPPAENAMDSANNATGRECSTTNGSCYENCTYAYTHAMLFGLGGKRDNFPDAEQ